MLPMFDDTVSHVLGWLLARGSSVDTTEVGRVRSVYCAILSRRDLLKIKSNSGPNSASGPPP
jgi:hypothetical protein